MLKTADSLHIHPKTKLLLYHPYVLSKSSWHFTVTDLGKTLISENLDNIVSKDIHQWFEFPISSTLSSIVLPSSKFGLAFQLPSVKFQQCQTVLRSSLKSSTDKAIIMVWRNTNCGANIQYDIYKNKKQVLKSIRTEHIDRLQAGLPSQGLIISFLLAHSLKNLNSLWSRALSKLPFNIFNFTIKYLNNTLATRKNLHLWGLSNTSDCSFCLQLESLVAGCKTYFDQGRFTLRHNSALRFLAQTVQLESSSKLYMDLPGYQSPWIITGDRLRPDMLLSTANKIAHH